MANWCENKITFLGEERNVEQVLNLFQELAKREEQEQEAQLPSIATDKNTRYCFNIVVECGVVEYQTKWEPNLDLTKLICDTYGVNAVHEYEEHCSFIYGKYFYDYEKKIEVDKYLLNEDFERYDYDDELGCYFFNEERYESAEEMLHILWCERYA
ncbi:hypothetical protein ACQ1Q5_00145 [Ornithobacterium rhinotracheale]